MKSSKLLYQRVDDCTGSVSGETDMYIFRLENGHCVAVVALGIDAKGKWATVYEIVTEPQYRNQGECQRLLQEIKRHFANDVRFGLWCPMNDAITHICKKLNITTYT